jgi:hypothetical protein
MQKLLDFIWKRVYKKMIKETTKSIKYFGKGL